jgi:nucleoside-diphosphate-sugar epimerase
MRVLVTRWSGHSGRAVIRELCCAGHQVVRVAGSEESAGKPEAVAIRTATCARAADLGAGHR